MSAAEASATGIDGDVDALFRQYRIGHGRDVRNELVLCHRWIAHYCAKRFVGRGESFDDLLQVANLGVVKAVERFDPDHGVAFATYAIPTVLGELRRHFRDAAWTMHVGRRAKDLSVALRREADLLSQQLGRSPTITELATHLHVEDSDVLLALDALHANRLEPLEPGEGDVPATATAAVGSDDFVRRLVVRKAIGDLSRCDRRIVHLRYYEGLTQHEIAERIGSNQVQVSRRLRRINAQLQARLREVG